MVLDEIDLDSDTELLNIAMSFNIAGNITPTDVTVMLKHMKMNAH